MALGYDDTLVADNETGGYDLTFGWQVEPLIVTDEDGVTGWGLRNDDGPVYASWDKYFTHRETYDTALAAVTAVIGPPPVDLDYLTAQTVHESTLDEVEPGALIAVSCIEGAELDEIDAAGVDSNIELAGSVDQVLAAPTVWRWYQVAHVSDEGVCATTGFRYGLPATGNVVVLVPPEGYGE